MNGKIRVLITRDFPGAGLEILDRNGFDLDPWEKDRPMTPRELVSRAKNCQAMVCTLTEKIDKAFITANPQLEMISQFAVGFDNIDVDFATKAKIPVGFTPDTMTEATADIAFGLMIATARKMFFLHKKILRGEWGFFRPRANLGMELRNKTLGIFGMGRIGMQMARLCKAAYDMKVIYHNRSRNMEAENLLNAQWVEFDTLAAQSDVVSVHSVLSPETRGIFNGQAFARMKSSAIFINTARGPIHNEADLLQALELKEVWGAGLDVTDTEPMDRGNPLLSMENVCILPHVGSATQEARDNMSVRAAENIVEFYRTGRVPFLVNPRVFD
ncbi:MAG: D-glycerate dehydrogenase [Desulfobacter sp.]|nr:D-glycerate dehydrogenase [Desulfobacter sp.]WDP84054.1 MAG: D-glycerate dehydrogenase [Desulfobacter sp.]